MDLKDVKLPSSIPSAEKNNIFCVSDPLHNKRITSGEKNLNQASNTQVLPNLNLSKPTSINLKPNIAFTTGKNKLNFQANKL